MSFYDWFIHLKKNSRVKSIKGQILEFPFYQEVEILNWSVLCRDLYISYQITFK